MNSAWLPELLVAIAACPLARLGFWKVAAWQPQQLCAISILIKNTFCLPSYCLVVWLMISDTDLGITIFKKPCVWEDSL